jgi:hypothetical protein
LGQSDRAELDLDSFDLGIDAGTPETHLMKAQARRQEAPMQITDLELGPVVGGRP